MDVVPASWAFVTSKHLRDRITDADDDYTVTADQRAALMELESLTWNYPTPQQARGRASSLSHGAKDDSDDSEDDDDDESYCEYRRDRLLVFHLRKYKVLYSFQSPTMSLRALIPNYILYISKINKLTN